MRWTQDEIDRLRDKMSLAKRAGAWVSGQEVWMVLGLIQFWRRMTVRTGWQGPAEGAMPTIGSVRSQGVRGIIVECRRPSCGNCRKLGFDALGLADSVVFLEITKQRGFRCHKCGCREVHIAADFPSGLKSALSSHVPNQELS